MRNRPLCCICLLVLLLQGVIFLIRGGVSSWDIPTDSIFQVYDGQIIDVQGRVYRKSETANLQILYLKNNSINNSNILIYVKNKKAVAIGETVSVKGTVEKFEGARNPGNFDQALYYARQKIYGYIWCEEIQVVSGDAKILQENLYQLKNKWKSYLYEMLGEEKGAIMSAMLLGEKGDMDAEIKELYQKNGIGHLLAISGLHISFVGLLVYRIFRRLGAGYWISGLFAIMILSGYVCMIGFGISVLRAFVMLLLRIVADMFGRVYDMCTALFLAAAITVIKEPLCFADAGFWMSYGAILGILFVLPQLQKCFERNGKIVSGFCASLAVNIVLFPIQLWFYFEIPTYSFAWNVLAIPLMSILLGVSMLGSCLFWYLPVAKICFLICEKILDFYQWIGMKGSQLPMARLVLGKPSLWLVFAYFVALFCVLIGIQISKRRRYLWWGILLLCMTLFAVPKRGELSITMIDVGQGDCIFMQGPKGGTYLIDAGSSDVEQVGKYRIEPFLKSQGVGEIDYVFVSHGDTDHCNGILEMLERQHVGVKIRNLVLPYAYGEDACLNELQKMAEKKRIKVLHMKAGDSLTEGEFQIRCLQTGKEVMLEGNAGSMILEQRFGEFSMLCTGDVEGEGEECLLRHLKEREYKVLKVAHHGSKNSTSEEFLETVKPQVALISAGEDNPYQHPNHETLERLEQVKCKIYSTEKSGAITMRTDGNSLTIK